MGVPVANSRKRRRAERAGLEGFLFEDEEFASAASADDYEDGSDSSGELLFLIGLAVKSLLIRMLQTLEASPVLLPILR